MFIPIPIPMGVKRIAAVRGAVWKFVSCGQCRERYAYLVELEATGEDHDVLFLDAAASVQRARAQAAQNLLTKGQNCVLPVPCPSCGYYQEDMSRMLKEEVSINALQIAGVVIVALSLVPLAFSFTNGWVLTLALAAAGLGLLGYGYVVAFRFDPNAGDPEARKTLGRKYAVWGQQLTELLAAYPPGEAPAAPDGGGK